MTSYTENNRYWSLTLYLFLCVYLRDLIETFLQVSDRVLQLDSLLGHLVLDLDMVSGTLGVSEVEGQSSKAKGPRVSGVKVYRFEVS